MELFANKTWVIFTIAFNVKILDGMSVIAGVMKFISGEIKFQNFAANRARTEFGNQMRREYPR